MKQELHDAVSRINSSRLTRRYICAKLEEVFIPCIDAIIDEKDAEEEFLSELGLEDNK